MSKTYKCLIVDDEPLAIKLLADHITKVPQLEVAGSCNNAFDAKEKLSSIQIDILFLDIQMEGISGIDLLKIVKNPPATILTTAFSEYALEGYELNVIDYLLKPISFPRCYKAISKIIDKEPLTIPNQTEKIGDSFIFLKTDQKILKINFDSLLYIKGMREYVSFITLDSKFLILKSLNSLEQELPNNIFTRVHKSYIVNTKFIAEVDGNMLKLEEHEIPIGKTYKESVFKFINDHKIN